MVLKIKLLPNEKKIKKLISFEQKKIIGDIHCIYNIKDTSKNIKIFGDEFIKESEFDIYIDDQKYNFSKEYLFKLEGNHNIKIDLYENINMNYMFKNVQDLISVKMVSNYNCQILSMISTFENCKRFNFISISGFDLEQLKSMSKLFYNSTLNSFSFLDFNTSNLEDISYMFANTSIKSISLNDFNTEKVTNMSHLFAECIYLKSIDLSKIQTNEVKDMSYMFSSCMINNLDISNFQTNKVVNMSYMFNNCYYLYNLNLKNFDKIKLLI
jgi:surface protein